MNLKLVSLITSATLGLGLNPTTNNKPTKNTLTMNTPRVIVTVPSESNIKTIKEKIPEVDVKFLGNGQAIVYSNKISETVLNKKLSNIKEVKKIKKPDKLRVVDPVSKQLVSSKNSSKLSNTYPSMKSSDVIANDPYYKYEWDITNSQSNTAWNLLKQQRQIKVAVIDTGVDYNHADLKGKIDTTNGYNFVTNSKEVMDDNGHGTHVSGIIGANYNNNIGVTGIAGKTDIKILPIKVLDKDGSGYSDIIAQGIIYAVDKGADIINMSLGGVGQPPEINAAIDYAASRGVFIVAAAGNDNTNCYNYSPAGNPKVFTVSAISINNMKTYFSNYGTNVSIAAPGMDIISTVPGGYAFMSGTSMASPVVAGIAGMIKAQNPRLTSTQIAKVLNNSAVDLGPKGKDIYYGYGKVNAYGALRLASSIK